MSRFEHPTVHIRLVAVDPPFETGDGVLFGLQDKRGEVDPVPATATSPFDTVIEIVATEGDGLDFRGDHVQGRKGDRFLYLSWGVSDASEPFVMCARAKIKLFDIPSEFISGLGDGEPHLVCELAATDAEGQPASGTTRRSRVRPPAVVWGRRAP